MKKLFLALLLLATPLGATEYFVSPSGVSTNAGTKASPWSLACAISAAGCNGTVPTGGDTVWLRGNVGAYTGAHGNAVNVFPMAASGTGQKPLIFRGYPGDAKPQLNCQTEPDYNQPGNCLVYTTPTKYVWLWGVDIAPMTAGPNNAVAPRRVTYIPGPYTDINFGSCVTSTADGTAKPGLKLINSLVHDCHHGLSPNIDMPGFESYGVNSYNHGADGPSGQVSTFNVTAQGSGYTQYSPLYSGYPEGNVSGGGGTSAKFVASFNNGAFIAAWMTDGGSASSPPTTCNMPSGGGGSGATCGFILAGNTVVEVHVTAPGSGYLSTNVTRNANGTDTTGAGAFGTKFTISSGAITAISAIQKAASIDGVGHDYCTTASEPSGYCVPVVPACAVVGGGGSGATCTTAVTAIYRSDGHDAYIQSQQGAYFNDTVLGNPFGNGMQEFVSDPQVGSLRQIGFDGVIAFCVDGPERTSTGGALFDISGDIPQGNYFTNTYTYGVGSARGGATGGHTFGWTGKGGLTIVNNYWASWGDWALLAPYAGASAVVDFVGPVTGNTYIGLRYPSTQWDTTYAAGNTNYSGESGESYPTSDFTTCRVNRYEKGRGHCVFYAWTNLNTAGNVIASSISRNLNISSIVPSGATYSIYNLENPLGAAVATGTCSPCTSVAVTLADTATVATPINGIKTARTTQPVFGSFLVTTNGFPVLAK